MKMYNCNQSCLCKKCTRIKRNCAECKISVNKTKECLENGIKQCESFIEDEKD